MFGVPEAEAAGGGPAEPPARGLHRRGDHWIWVGGPVPPGSDAITIGSVVSVRRGSAGSAHLLRHEEEHVRQWRELGAVGFLRRYLGAYVGWRWKGLGHKAAYRMIPLEVEAEAAAAAMTAAAAATEPPVDVAGSRTKA